MMSASYDIGDDSPSPSDQEELLNAEESEVSSDAEEAPATCSAKDSPEPPVMSRAPAAPSSSLDMLLTGLVLSLSAAALMILYPLYFDEVKSMGAPLPALLFPSTACVAVLLLLVLILGKIGCFGNVSITRCPFPFKRLCEASASYGGGCLLIAFSQDSGRVPCHLQDPLKAVIILFSLLYYFFLCKKMLGLRKLFSASVMAVGLFIAADYGLCDEFKCRGAESRVVGSWEARAGWTVTYVIGLGLFTLHFTLTEEHVILRPPGALYLSLSGSLLATVSRLVAREETCDRIYAQSIDNSTQNLASRDQCCSIGGSERNGKKSSLLVALWIQTITWILVVSTGVFYLTATTVKDFASGEALLNSTMEGLSCHIPHWAPSGSVQHLVSSVPVSILNDRPQQISFNERNEDFSNSQGFYTKSLTSKRHLLDHAHVSNKNSRVDPGKQNPDITIHKQHRYEKQNMNIKFEKMANIKLRIKKMRRNKINIKAVEKQSTQLKLMTTTESTTNSEVPRQNETKNVEINSTMAAFVNSSDQLTKDSKDPPQTMDNLEQKKLKRTKRYVIQTNALGFKIIQPTISFLQGHVITTKVKPNLIGHVILNKTDIRITGHKITFKKDPFSPVPEESTTHKNIVKQTSLPQNIPLLITQYLSQKNNIVKKKTHKSLPKHLKENSKSKIVSHHHRKHKSKLNERKDVYRYKREADLQPFNDSTNMENFFKNLKMGESHPFESDDKTGELHSKHDDSEIITYEAPENNFVRITDKKQSELNKFMNRVDANVIYTITKLESGDCARIALYGWAVFLAYTAFTISSVRFLILCQSSVFTISMMTPALPLTGVWWALFSQNADRSLTLRPGMSGELICALLGLPIVLLGLTLLFKAHLNQTYPSPQVEQGLQSVFSGPSSRQSTEKLCGDDIAYELGSGPQMHHA